MVVLEGAGFGAVVAGVGFAVIVLALGGLGETLDRLAVFGAESVVAFDAGFVVGLVADGLFVGEGVGFFFSTFPVLSAATARAAAPTTPATATAVPAAATD